MIRPLRQRHRQIMAGLTVFLPLALLGSVWLRQPRAGMASLPAALASAPAAAAEMLWERNDLFAQAPIRARFWQVANPPGQVVELTITGAWAQPDVLVYWTAMRGADTNALPGDAVLLGPLATGVRLPLPERAAATFGRLVLYSLADGDILETSQPLTKP